MKNRIKLLGLIALVTAIGFSLIACGDGGGGSKVPARVRAFDNSQPQGSPPMPSSPSMGPMRSAGFSEYDTFYTWMGSNKGTPTQITPTKFAFSTSIAFVASTGEFETVNNIFTVIDFAVPGGFTVTIGDIPTDITCSAILFTLSDVGGAVEFVWPGGEDGFNANSFYTGTFDTSTNKATIGFTSVDPNSARLAATINSSPPEVITAPLRNIAYGVGPEKKYSVNEIGTWELVGLSQQPSHFLFYPGPYVFIPFTPVHIPSSASLVTIHVSWNLDGIISHYNNNTASNYSDDIFVLKNGWWDGLQINLTVQ